MRKQIKKRSISLAIVSCLMCLCGATALLLPKTLGSAPAKAEVATVSASDFYVNAAGARLINDASGAGVRFHTRMTDEAYATLTAGNYKTGTLIIPDFRCDGELTLDDLNNEAKNRPVHIDTTNIWWDNKEKEGWMQSTAYLYDIPEIAYGVRYVVRSYAQYADGTTVYTNDVPDTSLADIAYKVTNGSSYGETEKAQLVPYLIDETTVTYVMPDGSKQTETVDYGSKLVGPTYSDAFTVTSMTDQYGNKVDLSTYSATIPATITVTLEENLKDEGTIAQIIKDGYAATAAERAFQNGSTATPITDAANADLILAKDNGYSSVLRLDWYQNSTSLWKAGGNPFYRSCYSQNDISGYKGVRFAFKLETSGDACVQIYPMQTSRNSSGVIRNEWLGVQLLQTSANVWSVTITRLSDGSVVYSAENVTRNNSGLNDVDSIASLVFPACKWDSTSLSVMLQPCTSAEMTASIYMTEAILSDDALIPSMETPMVLADALNGETSSNITVMSDNNGEAAPDGFNSVTRFYSDDKTWSSYILARGDYDETTVTDYEELWVALKITNGKITMTAPEWKDIDSYTVNPWVYFHMTQTSDAVWTIEIIKDNAVWYTIENQSGTTIAQIFDHTGNPTDGGRIVIYQDRDNLTEPVNIYSTEVRGILKDGAVAPDSGVKEFTLPDNAVVASSSIWRANNYALSSSTSESAPKGFKNVEEFNWCDNPANWAETGTDMQATCFDETSVVGYSDIYFAVKFVGGNGIYIRGAAKYTGGDWLYAHFAKSNGTWSLSVQSADGRYVQENVQTGITGDTLLTLMSYSGSNGTTGTGFYPTKNADETNAIFYMTEMYGVPEETFGERAIWSAADGSTKSNDAIGLPLGFTSIYKVDGFAADGFASMDLTNTIYQELRFGFLATQDFTFKSAYNYTVAGEDTPRPTTTIMSKPSNANIMNLVTLTKNDDGSWHVAINARRWVSAPAGGGSSAQTSDLFETDVTANSLSAIMSTLMSPAKNMTLYVTEVRGTHVCAYNSTKSLGNGYLQDYCICGEAMSEPYEFAHGIENEAVMVNDSIWRDNNYALSTPDQEAPAGFDNIEMYQWNLNSTMANGVPYGSTSKDMPLTCLDEADVSAYDEVWFAMKNVGGTGFYVRGGNAYTGSDWLYYHLVKVDDAWTVSLSSPDGYVANNVQTGIVGNTLKDILSYNAYSASKPWNSGAYPTKAEGDTTTDVRIYFTEILGVIGCEHTTTEYESNGDGTHTEVCASCGKTMGEATACVGGEATCTAQAVCSLCNTAYGEMVAHTIGDWVLGKQSCTVCGKVLNTAAVVADSAIIDSTNANLTLSNNAAGITAPEGFSKVTNLFSASGNTWANKILTSADYAGATLTAFSEVWFAIAIQGGHFTNTADSWKNLDADNQLVWVNFHLTQTAENTWTVSIYVDGTLYKTFANRPGDTIYELTENNNNGLRLVIYQQTDGTNSTADVNVYATEVLGVFNTGIASYATNVWDHIWNPYYFTGGGAAEGAYSDEAAPVGFSKVSEYTWTGKDFAYKYGHFNASDISAYSDIWFAMKTNAPANIYLQGAPNSGAITGEWVYVHYHQVSDGVWTKDYRTTSGFYSPATNHTNITGTKLTDMIGWKSGINQGSYPTAAASETATAYFTEVIGVLACDGTNHTADVIASNGDGTHSETCRCGVAVSASTACSGGTATCTKLAVCSTCGSTYGELVAHSAIKYVSNGDGTHSGICACGATVNTTACAGGTATCSAKAVCTTCKTAYGATLSHEGAWSGDDFICSNCGENFGSVDTELDKQTSALFTDATSITANEATALTIDLTSATDLTISAATVTLGGKEYAATVANNIVTIDVIPYNVFGEYEAVVVATVEGRTFEITAPTLVVTNMITKADTMLAMKYILRGKTTTAKVADTSAQTENVIIYQGGTGGAGTMHGNGYYMLGNDIRLTQDGGGYTDVYVWGTTTVPFVGTFDGNGHVISDFVKTNWFSGHVLEETVSTGSYQLELEGSLFGYVNGTVKHVAFTGVQLGIYANIVLDGKGMFEDVYVEITNLHHNANLYIAPFFWRNGSTANGGTLRNVVFNFNNHSSSILNDDGNHTNTSNTHYPAATGKYFAAENVGVYGFNKNWLKANGTSGNVYYTDATNDGSAAGIYVEYVDDTTNGASFWISGLDSELWKIVDGVPMLKNVTASGTTVAPDDNQFQEQGDSYNIVWNDHENGSFEAVDFINDVTKASTGSSLAIYDMQELSTQQIVVGTYNTYMHYLTEKFASNPDLTLNGNGSANYGIYRVENTIFVLAENEEAFGYAAKELCRQLYGWNEMLFDYSEEVVATDVVYNSITADAMTTALQGLEDYTTNITFNHRQAAFSNDNTEKDSLGFTRMSHYSTYVAMHNSKDYFYADTTTWSESDTTWQATDSSNAILTSTNDGQICYLGHGDSSVFNKMINHVAAIMVAEAVAKPAMTTINFMIEDNALYCQCSACGNFSNASIPQLIFLNKLASVVNSNAELVAAGRTLNIEFFAYSMFQYAPVLESADQTALANIKTSYGLGDAAATDTFTYSALNAAGATYAAATSTTEHVVLKAHKNLRLDWTSHKANHSFALSHEANDHMYLALLAWIASVGAENIEVFMYQTPYRDYFLPLNTWEYQVLWYQELNKLGVHNSMFSLGNVHNKAGAQTAFMAFKTYIDSRAMTDVNVTFDELKNEFFATNGYYGEAGPTMRTFFEELVSAMESKKQGEDNDNAFMNLKAGYLDPTDLVNWDNSSDTQRRQSFFNGAYGYNMDSVVFPDASAGATSATLTPAQDLYVHSKYSGQRATLEGWYNYCQTALSEVSDAQYDEVAKAKYQKRINVEMIFPEYAILMLHSTYTTKMKYASLTGWNSGTITVTLSSEITIESIKSAENPYEDFYTRVVALDVEKPSEFFGFDSKNVLTVAGYKSVLGTTTSFGLYESFFSNWGVL